MMQLVIYDHPEDYPHGFVCRRWHIGVGTMTAEAQGFGFPSLDAAREWVRTTHPELDCCIERTPGDAPCVVEVWL